MVQALIALVGLIFAYGRVSYLPTALSTTLRSDPNAFLILTSSIITAIAVAGFFALIVILISWRSRLGLWLGLICLILFLCAAIFSQYRSASAWRAGNEAERFGALVGQLVSVALYFTLMFRFALSKRAREYWSGLPRDSITS
jgi:ABC-type multidrug transport system fused ATPase/permease subunit